MKHRHSCPWKDQTTPHSLPCSWTSSWGTWSSAKSPGICSFTVPYFLPISSKLGHFLHTRPGVLPSYSPCSRQRNPLPCFYPPFILHRVRTALTPAHFLLWTLNHNIVLHPQHQLPSCGAVLGFAQPWIHVVLNHLARPMALAVLIDNYSCGTRCAGW